MPFVVVDELTRLTIVLPRGRIVRLYDDFYSFSYRGVVGHITRGKGELTWQLVILLGHEHFPTDFGKGLVFYSLEAAVAALQPYEPSY